MPIEKDLASASPRAFAGDTPAGRVRDSLSLVALFLYMLGERGTSVFDMQAWFTPQAISCYSTDLSFRIACGCGLQP